MGKRLSWVCPPQKGTQKHAVNSMPFSCKVSQYNHTQMDQAAPLQPLLSERVPFFCLPACSNLPVHSAGVQKPGWVWGDSGLEEGGQWQAVAVATGRGPALGEGGGGRGGRVSMATDGACSPLWWHAAVLNSSYPPRAGHGASGMPLLSPVCAANFISS